MTECSSASKRAARLIVGFFFASVVAIAGVSSHTPASAAACDGCVVLSAPAIGLNVTAQPGKQAVIDQEGGVAVYTPLTTGAVGAPGTLWLVGHRTTHGSVFNLVPTLVAGDEIYLIDDAGSHRYIVDRLVVVSESNWSGEVNIHDTSRSRLILQTSHPESHLRYLIEAFATGEVSAPAVATPVTTAPPAVTSSPVAAASVAVTPAPVRVSKFGSIKS